MTIESPRKDELRVKDPTTSLTHWFDMILGITTNDPMIAMLVAPNS